MGSSMGPRSSTFVRSMSSYGPQTSLPAGQGAQLKGCSVGAAAMLDKHKLQPAGSGPVWKGVSPGLCIEGRCKTPSCQAYGHTVIYNAGFTSLDLINSRACRCPCCQHRIKPTTAAFHKCEWQFSGTKLDTPEAAPEAVAMQQWQHAGGDYERFKEDEDDKSVWTKLIITTRPLPSTHGSIGPSEQFSKKRTRDTSNSSDPNLVECSICCGEPLSRFGPTSISTPCGHCFHRDCLKPWVLDGHKGCPTCRRDVSCLAKELQKPQ